MFKVRYAPGVNNDVEGCTV